MERDAANIADQTYDHPEYMRNGPWMSANALAWYTQEYSIMDNYTSVKCTGIRQWGEGQKGFFDLPIGDTVTLNMGYRVYENESATRARMHRDYTNISFELLNNKARVEETGAVALSAYTATVLAAVSLFLSF